MQHKHCSPTENLSDLKDMKLAWISQIVSEVAGAKYVQADTKY
jgi:hypothetical protein